MVYLGSKSGGSLPVLTYDEDCESSQRGNEYGYEQSDSTGLRREH